MSATTAELDSPKRLELMFRIVSDFCFDSRPLRGFRLYRITHVDSGCRLRTTRVQ